MAFLFRMVPVRWGAKMTPVLFLSIYVLSAAFSNAMTDSEWTEWLQYIKKTSSSRAFLDSKVSLPSSQVRFTEDSCLKASTVVTVNGTNVNTQHRFVSKDGSGNFTTIQAAIESIPKHNEIPTLICIGAGEYREKVQIRKTRRFITIIGSSSGNTIIRWNDTASTISPQTSLPMKTYNSPTMSVNADFFVAWNIIVENDAPPPQQGQIDGQAVAFRISGNYGALYNCKFLGHQDTLYDHKGRHYFKHCFIQGNVDFIFGNGRSIYKDCYARALPIEYESVGAVTAQKRGFSNFDSGFSFLNCNISGDGKVYLGRAWGNESRVVFAYTWMGDVVVPEGWNDFGFPARERTVFYAEYECSGPGANNSTRVSWARQLTPDEAQPFLSVGFINGEEWLLDI